MKEVRVGDLLKLKDFDPMNVDVTYISETLDRIPKDGTIDINEAECLATIFLRCADYCDNLFAQAIRYAGYTDAKKRSEKANAIERKIGQKVAGTIARETYSNDPQFEQSCDRATDAQAFLTWITQKRDNLIKAHVLCKDLLKSHSTTRNVSGWDGSEEDFPKNSGDTTPKTTIKRKSSDDLDFDVEVDVGDEIGI